MTADALHPSPITFRECTLRAVVLTPQRPIANWLIELDESAGQHQDTFAGRAVLLDLSALRPTKVELKALLAKLKKRDIRIMAVEGIDPVFLGPGIPPLVDTHLRAEVAEVAPAADPPASTPARQAPMRVIEG